MTYQHVLGATALLKGVNFSPSHRKLAFIVANQGRFLVVFGMILAKKELYLTIGAATLTGLLFLATIKYYFELQKKLEGKPETVKKSGGAERQRSPPRDVKRD